MGAALLLFFELLSLFFGIKVGVKWHKFEFKLLRPCIIVWTLHVFYPTVLDLIPLKGHSQEGFVLIIDQAVKLNFLTGHDDPHLWID